MSFLFSALEVLDVALKLLVVIFLLRQGSFRKYLLILIYSLVQLATSLGEVVVLHEYGRNTTPYRKLFWTDELLTDLLLFLIVIALTFRAMEGNPMKAAFGKMLGAVVVIVLLLPFVVFHGPIFKVSGDPNVAWFDHTSQLLNFGGALLNLGLWSALLASRRRDSQLLMVSTGLGIAVAGAAISYGLRRLVPATGPWNDAANLFYVLTRSTSVFIWCMAFRPSRQPTAPPLAVPTL